jgi:hypothetical protein
VQDPQVDHHEVRNPAILAATITLEAFEELRLRVGQEACAVIKVRSTFRCRSGETEGRTMAGPGSRRSA